MDEFEARRAELRRTMKGFDDLIWTVQGLLVTFSLATAAVWETPSTALTETVALDVLDEVDDLVRAWGIWA